MCTELMMDSPHIWDPEGKTTSYSKLVFKVESNQHLV